MARRAGFILAIICTGQPVPDDIIPQWLMPVLEFPDKVLAGRRL